MAYKTITIDDALCVEIETWAKDPKVNRSFSNAVEVLARKGLEQMKKEAVE